MEISSSKTVAKSPPKKVPPQMSPQKAQQNPHKKSAPTKHDKGKGKAEPSAQKSPPKVKRNTSQTLSISKMDRIPLMNPDLHKIFKEKWSGRPIVPGRYFDFKGLEDENKSCCACLHG